MSSGYHEPMRIKQLSARTGASADTIRYYERAGLLLPPPARGDNNYRIYKEQHAERLAFIRRARQLDMSLQEIRTLLQWHDRPQSNCSAVDALIDAHIAHIRSRMRELRTLERELKQLRARCQHASVAADCGILNELERGSTLVAAPEPRPHVAGAHGHLAQRN